MDSQCPQNGSIYLPQRVPQQTGFISRELSPLRTGFISRRTRHWPSTSYVFQTKRIAITELLQFSTTCSRKRRATNDSLHLLRGERARYVDSSPFLLSSILNANTEMGRTNHPESPVRPTHSVSVASTLPEAPRLRRHSSSSSTGSSRLSRMRRARAQF